MSASPVADPFAEMDAGYGAGVVRDPYPVFAALRRRCPVQPMSPHEMLGLNLGPAPENAPPVFSVLGHAEAMQVLRDGESFSSSAYGTTMGVVMGRTILQMDEPEHGRYRGLIQKAFTRKALSSWDQGLIRPVVDRYVDAFAARGRAELRRELTFPFPVAVIAGMLGLPDRDLEAFHRWAVELISIGFDWERSVRASRTLHGYFSRLLAERRAEPRDDLISALALAELDGERLGDEEIIAFLRLLLPAGAETTYRSASNLIFALLTHPEQLEALRRDRSLLDRAIEEGLRWECPITQIIRTATRDTVIAGVPIPAGAVLGICIAAANRDESRYEDPDRFDIFRPGRQGIGFGFGAHRCLGMHLARLETQAAIEALLDRLPNLRLDPAAEDVHVTGLVFRSPTSLPVLFDPA